jgi:hypothetical protein
MLFLPFSRTKRTNEMIAQTFKDPSNWKTWVEGGLMGGAIGLVIDWFLKQTTRDLDGSAKWAAQYPYCAATEHWYDAICQLEQRLPGANLDVLMQPAEALLKLEATYPLPLSANYQAGLLQTHITSVVETLNSSQGLRKIAADIQQFVDDAIHNISQSMTAGLTQTMQKE